MTELPAATGVGSDFVGYRIEELVGQGGMGVVYRAYDLRLKRTVALKLITPELALDERFRVRFTRETELAMALEHPNVVPIHDAGDVDGRLYLAMRLVEGGDLRVLLRKEGPLEPARALAICRQVANALDAAHAKGLIHRDVKPSNVLLDQAEHVYLADFGLTRRLDGQGAQPGDGRSIGTPAYLAPEQIEGGSVDGRADVYALGCLLYECLTGEAPFAGSRLAVAWAHLEEEPPSARDHRPELPDSIDAVFRKAMAKEPEDRYPTCAESITAAKYALGVHEPGGSRFRRRALVTVPTVALVAGVVASVLIRGGAATPTATPNSLVKIDARTNKVVDVVPVGRDPRVVAIVGSYVFVASEGDGTLTRVDRRTGAVVNSGQYGATGGLVGEGGKQVWVSSGTRGGVTAVNVELPEVVLPSRGPSRLQVPLPRDGSSAFLAVGGGSLWISGAATIERWRLHPLHRERRYLLQPSDFGLEPAFGFGAAWVALGSPANTLLRIDGRTGSATRIPVGNFAVGPATGFGSVWVAMLDDDAVWRIDPVTGRTQAVIEVGDGPMDVAVGAGSVWVTNHCGGTVSRINPRTNTVSETIHVGLHPQWLAAGAEGAWIDVSGRVFGPLCPDKPSTE